MAHISVQLRQQVGDRSGYRCEYCYSPEHLTGGPFHVEHIRSRAQGGVTDATNLAYACVHAATFTKVSVRVLLIL